MRGERTEGNSACREMDGGLPQPREGRQTAENKRTPATPLSAGARSPAARGVVNVSKRGRRWKEHDEAVKMVNFSRSKKPAKCEYNMGSRESLVTGLWSPGSRSGVRYGDIFRIWLN